MRDSTPFLRFMNSTRPIDLDGIDWTAARTHPIHPDVLKIVHYMQDVESHTVVFPRTIFSKRALADEAVGPFLICWLYEETMHGRALSRFLDSIGHPAPPRIHMRTTLRDRIDRAMTTMMSAWWKDFLALHMTWGAVHECTTIQAYKRLIAQNDHPVLNELLHRIIRDEARHFAFYMWQAEERLSRPGVAQKVRAIMDRFYVPVGAAHHADAQAAWVSGFLFGGEDGRKTAQHVDHTISKLPGFADAKLLGRWFARHVDY